MHSLQILSIRLIPSGEFDFVYVNNLTVMKSYERIQCTTLNV